MNVRVSLGFQDGWDRVGGQPGEASGVEDATGVSVDAGALEQALKTQEASWLALALGLLEVHPALHLNKAAKEDLHKEKGVCRTGQDKVRFPVQQQNQTRLPGPSPILETKAQGGKRRTLNT